MSAQQPRHPDRPDADRDGRRPAPAGQPDTAHHGYPGPEQPAGGLAALAGGVPPHYPPAALLELQRSIGNAVVARLVREGAAGRRGAAGQEPAPGPTVESEEDRSGSAREPGGRSAQGLEPGGRRVRAREPGSGGAQALEPVGGGAQAREPGGGRPEPAPVQRSAVAGALGGSGRPLSGSLRAEMEARLGADFSDVRLHTGPVARDSARELGARAYTSGSHVVIGAGGSDKHTLAHELTHVMQQRQGPVSGTNRGDGLRVSDPGDRFERAAEANAARVMSAGVPGPSTDPTHLIAGKRGSAQATGGRRAPAPGTAPDQTVGQGSDQTVGQCSDQTVGQGTDQNVDQGTDQNVDQDTDQGAAVQRAVVYIIGPENEGFGATALADSAASTVARNQRREPDLPSDSYTHEQVLSGSFRAPRADETIYFIGHGDDPRQRNPRLGDYSAPELVKLLKALLKAFSRGDQYRGEIQLAGCHSAVRQYTEDGEVTGGSLLDELLRGLQDEKWAREKIAPQVRIVGYPGELLDTGPDEDGEGVVAIGSPPAKREHLANRRQVTERKQGEEGEFFSSPAEDAAISYQWRQKPTYKTG